MENNTQLPVEVVREINEQADKYGFVVPYDGSNKFYNDDKVEGYKAGATVYASKLHQIEQENAELRGWKIEAAELLTKIHSYAHKHLEIKLGESIVDFVIARAKERDELKRQNDKMKQQAEGWRPLLEETLSEWDSMFFEMQLKDKITKFLYGE